MITRTGKVIVPTGAGHVLAPGIGPCLVEPPDMKMPEFPRNDFNDTVNILRGAEQMVCRKRPAQCVGPAVLAAG